MNPNKILFLIAVGCGGTAPQQEPDPNLDSDADGIPDAEEQALGTDPNAFDTDGDGYGDGDEVREGSDPLDAESKIFLF